MWASVAIVACQIAAQQQEMKRMVTNTRPPPPVGLGMSSPPARNPSYPKAQQWSDPYKVKQYTYEEMLQNQSMQPYQKQQMFPPELYSRGTYTAADQAMAEYYTRLNESRQRLGFGLLPGLLGGDPAPAKVTPEKFKEFDTDTKYNSYLASMQPGDDMRISKHMLEDNPSWKVALLGSEFDVENHPSGDIYIRKRTKEDIKRAKEEEKVEEVIDPVYRDLADIESPMFDPLTCLKNNIPWQAVRKGEFRPKLQLLERQMKHMIDMRQKTQSTGVK